MATIAKTTIAGYSVVIFTDITDPSVPFCEITKGEAGTTMLMLRDERCLDDGTNVAWPTIQKISDWANANGYVHN